MVMTFIFKHCGDKERATVEKEREKYYLAHLFKPGKKCYVVDIQKKIN